MPHKPRENVRRLVALVQFMGKDPQEERENRAKNRPQARARPFLPTL